MNRTTTLKASFETSGRSSKDGSAIFRLSLQHSTRCTKIDRPPVRHPAKLGYADRCSPNVAARETRLPGRRRWNAQFPRPFFRTHRLVSRVLVFEVPAVLSPPFYRLRRPADHKHWC